MGTYKKISLIVTILFTIFLNQMRYVHASGSIVVRERHPRYTEVVVGPERYYYNGGVFYTGSPGSYVVVEPPVGAVIYDVPSAERVVIDGNVYFRYHDTYYRHIDRGYEVVRVETTHRDRPHWRDRRRY